MYLAKAHGRNRAYGVRLMEARTAQQVREMKAQAKASIARSRAEASREGEGQQ